MDEVRQLGELLAQHASSEESKKQQFSQQCEHWRVHINRLFDQIEQWFEPLTGSGHLLITREAWRARNASYVEGDSPFHTQKMLISLAARTVELVPEVMGPKGSIQVAVQGLTSDRHGSISLVSTPPSNDWLWRKERGAKDPEVIVLSGDLLALQLQALIPKTRD